jgi:uncharacterized protein YsxB (DUF464 family)
MEVNVVNGFNVVPVKDSEGEINSRELRFTVKTGVVDALKQVEQYVHSMGRGLAELKISYVKQVEMFKEAEESAE